MFFVFSTQNKIKTYNELEVDSCNNCQNKIYKLKSSRLWFQLFFINIFPVEKTRYYLECKTCGIKYDLYKEQFEQLV